MDVPVWITRPAVSWLMEVTAVVLYHMQFAVKTTNTAVPRDIGNITQRFPTPSPPPPPYFSFTIITVEPVLSDHPVLSGRSSKFRNFFALITVIFTSITRSPLLTLYALTSVSIFSTLFFIHFLRC